jgi:phage terminase large subunit GpA-like protein
MQRLVFEQLQWDEGKPETAKYFCIYCGVGIEERHKTEIFSQGEWRPMNPELSNTETIGFHISALYSPFGWYSWKDIASNFLKAKKNPNELIAFVNTVLGETWAEKGEAPPFMNLYNRRENYPLNVVPDDVCFLTCGADVQDDRIELEIVGWCPDKRSYSIDYRVLKGNPAGTEVWQKLAEVVDERFLRSDGVEFPIRLMAVDSGGHCTTNVYNFCRRFNGNRVIPIKGQDGLGMAISYSKQTDVTKSGKRYGKVRLWMVGVSFLKAEFYAILCLEKDSEGNPPPNYCHFPEYPEHYFRGLVSEEQVQKVNKMGHRKFEWKKVYERNEPLDCRIYARAAAVLEGLEKFSEKQLRAMIAPLQPKRQIENLSNTLENTERKKKSYLDYYFNK